MATNDLEERIKVEEDFGERLRQFAGEWVSVRDHEVIHHAANFDDLLSQIEGDPNPGSIMRVAEPGVVCFY